MLVLSPNLRLEDTYGDKIRPPCTFPSIILLLDHGCPQEFIGPYTKVTVAWAAGGGGPPLTSHKNKLLIYAELITRGVWGVLPQKILEN